MRLFFSVACAFVVLAAAPVVADSQFKDVPKDHWAAESVQVVKDAGVMNGYPGDVFKGDKPVTRYELAAALQNMIAYLEQSLKAEMGAESGKPKADSPQAGTPSKPAASHQASDGGKQEAGNPAQKIKAGGYIDANSPLLTDQKKSVSPQELAQALSSVAARIIEKNVAPPKD